MEIRVIIAGSRHFADYEHLCRAMTVFRGKLAEDDSLVIISGCARGADALGERYAAEHALPVYRCPAHWSHYGRSAGPRRNAEMAVLAVADGARGVLIAFWDGVSRGTASMIDEACKRGLDVYTVRIPPTAP